jgi:hypothetical protein
MLLADLFKRFNKIAGEEEKGFWDRGNEKNTLR